jgi:hypothetical protein
MPPFLDQFYRAGLNVYISSAGGPLPLEELLVGRPHKYDRERHDSNCANGGSGGVLRLSRRRIAVDVNVERMSNRGGDGQGRANFNTILQSMVPTSEERSVFSITENRRDSNKRKRSYGALGIWLTKTHTPRYLPR